MLQINSIFSQLKSVATLLRTYLSKCTHAYIHSIVYITFYLLGLRAAGQTAANERSPTTTVLPSWSVSSGTEGFQWEVTHHHHPTFLVCEQRDSGLPVRSHPPPPSDLLGLQAAGQRLAKKGLPPTPPHPFTFLVCRPWDQMRSSRSQRLAIRVFSSTPVRSPSPWPNSTASCPIFSTSIFFVCWGREDIATWYVCITQLGPDRPQMRLREHGKLQYTCSRQRWSKYNNNSDTLAHAHDAQTLPRKHRQHTSMRTYPHTNTYAHSGPHAGTHPWMHPLIHHHPHPHTHEQKAWPWSCTLSARSPQTSSWSAPSPLPTCPTAEAAASVSTSPPGCSATSNITTVSFQHQHCQLSTSPLSVFNITTVSCQHHPCQFSTPPLSVVNTTPVSCQHHHCQLSTSPLSVFSITTVSCQHHPCLFSTSPLSVVNITTPVSFQHHPCQFSTSSLSVFNITTVSLRLRKMWKRSVTPHSAMTRK